MIKYHSCFTILKIYVKYKITQCVQMLPSCGLNEHLRMIKGVSTTIF